MKKVVIITGGSSGIGKSTVLKLLENNFTVYTGARNIDKMKDIEKKGAKISFLDVTQEETMKKFVEKVISKEKRIDILINNAGYGSYGAVEDVPIEEAKRQFEVNLFGLARMTQLVLPIMRQQRSGKIINISSVGGKIWMPMGTWYHASKHAVEGFTDCLRNEIKQFGINAILIEPGAINTSWGKITVDNLRKRSENGAYKKIANIIADSFYNIYEVKKSGLSSDKVAEVIIKSIKSNKPKARYAVPFQAKMLLFLRRLLNDNTFDSLLLKFFKIPKKF
ncbi:short-chain dehydrogenase/reductase [Tepiditoga spiralis]|uniref:Short-chain dehydrogenase/reductase n=1 Tax=Tepiditoga spiralis TaxID=2108365 RepID=A0A7G1G445_9BACT|nr:oxidoreductase [Tepiditoga spiralis]BBE31250.1 short-chain dehydrogenase/reductase [Tepiditoga spiralis]